jgi:hypothetical protein
MISFARPELANDGGRSLGHPLLAVATAANVEEAQEPDGEHGNGEKQRHMRNLQEVGVVARPVPEAASRSADGSKPLRPWGFDPWGRPATWPGAWPFAARNGQPDCSFVLA